MRAIKIDWITLLLVGALSTMGLLALGAISNSPSQETDYFGKQLVFLSAGLIAMLGLQFVPSKYFYSYSYPAYAVIIVMLLAVLLFGNEVKGSTRWFLIGPLKLQPSELAKFVGILTVARFIAGHQTSLRKTKHLFLACLLLFIPFILINIQPDLGTSLTFLAIAIPVLYWGGMPSFYVFAIVSSIVVLVCAFDTFIYLIAISFCILCIYFFQSSPILKITLILVYIGLGIAAPKIWNDVLKPHQRSRIMSLVNPNDVKGAGYQVHQSKIAIGSGGELGKGLGKGTQVQLGLVPEVHTDFIIAIIGEEMGFWGVFITLVLFAFLIARLVFYAVQVKSQFSSIYLIAVATMLLYQVFTNMGMAIGIMPVTGLPLPLISYGGSALLTNLAILGVCSNFILNKYES
jgi:rod shape determining protein RodA